ncbi:hypothetical protein, partial [Brucella grignonensis]|uniref:hypothetical protein n=1 Tax=Brucella grignonensis TaxID=94627 RepID=UPI001ABF977F
RLFDWGRDPSGTTLQGQQSKNGCMTGGHTTALEMRCTTVPNSPHAGAFYTRCLFSTNGAGAFHMG